MKTFYLYKIENIVHSHFNFGKDMQNISIKCIAMSCLHFFVKSRLLNKIYQNVFVCASKKKNEKKLTKSTHFYFENKFSYLLKKEIKNKNDALFVLILFIFLFNFFLGF